MPVPAGRLLRMTQVRRIVNHSGVPVSLVRNLTTATGRIMSKDTGMDSMVAVRIASSRVPAERLDRLLNKGCSALVNVAS